MCLLKLVYTDSDCVVRENIHIFPIFFFFFLGGGGGFKTHQGTKKFSLVLTLLDTMEVGICSVVMDIS